MREKSFAQHINFFDKPFRSTFYSSLLGNNIHSFSANGVPELLKHVRKKTINLPGFEYSISRVHNVHNSYDSLFHFRHNSVERSVFNCTHRLPFVLTIPGWLSKSNNWKEINIANNIRFDSRSGLGCFYYRISFFCSSHVCDAWTVRNVLHDALWQRWIPKGVVQQRRAECLPISAA